MAATAASADPGPRPYAYLQSCGLPDPSLPLYSSSAARFAGGTITKVDFEEVRRHVHLKDNVADKEVKNVDFEVRSKEEGISFGVSVGALADAYVLEYTSEGELKGKGGKVLYRVKGFEGAVAAGPDKASVLFPRHSSPCP